MVEKIVFFLAEHFRVVQVIASVFMAFVVSFLIERLFVVRRQWYWKALIFSCGWLLSSMPIFIGDLMNLPPTILFFMVGILFACEGGLLKKLSLSFMIISLIISFNVLMDTYILLFTFDRSKVQGVEESIYLLIKLLFYLVIYCSVRKFVPKKSYELSNRLWGLLGLLTLTPFCTVLSIVLFQQYNHEMIEANAASNKMILGLCVLSFFGLIWAVVVLSHQYELEQSRQLLEINQLYYESLERHQLEVRKLRHDMKNHLETLAGLSGREQKDYLDNLLESPGIKRNVQYCANPVVNAVLSTKTGKMSQEQIAFECRLQMPEKINMDPVDLSVLFANSLDNAIEACEKLSQEGRKIFLQAKSEKGLLVMKIENPMKEEIGVSLGREENEGNMAAQAEGKSGEVFLPQTTKKDRKLHGYGLKSIREIVQRYEGSMEITKEEGKFTLFLYVPIS